MLLRRITAAVAALTLGAGFAMGCGSGDSPREQEKSGNPGVQDAPGSQSTVETNPTTLQSTAPTQPTVTQTTTGG